MDAPGTARLLQCLPLAPNWVEGHDADRALLFRHCLLADNDAFKVARRTTADSCAKHSEAFAPDPIEADIKGLEVAQQRHEAAGPLGKAQRRLLLLLLSVGLGVGGTGVGRGVG